MCKSTPSRHNMRKITTLTRNRYVQLHPAAYLIKLHIEMNIAELLGKVLKKSNQRRNSLASRTYSYDNSHFGSPSPPLMSSINRPAGGSDVFRERRLLSLDTALLDENDDYFNFRCVGGGGIHPGTSTTQQPNGTADRGDDDGIEPNQTIIVNGNALQDRTGEHLDSGGKLVRPHPVYRKDSAWSGTGTVSSCMTDPMDGGSDVSLDRDSVATI